MPELTVTLLPLAIGSALVPIHTLITALLLRAPGGRAAATAWIAGLTTTRLLQGVVFGLILAPVEQAANADEKQLILSVVLLVVAVVLLVMAARAWIREPDEDAPSPSWMTALEGMAPARAFVLGAAVLAVGPKFWVFTLGAIAAIGEADLGLGPAVVAYLVFVVLAASVQLVLLLVALVAPARADVALHRLSDGLTAHGRPIKVVLGVGFGLWFLLQALAGFDLP